MLDWLEVRAGRLLEQERALRAWEAAGGDVGRLERLARRVAAGRCTDWPGRWAGTLEWRACPALRAADPGPEGAARAGRGSRCGTRPDACACPRPWPLVVFG